MKVIKIVVKNGAILVGLYLCFSLIGQFSAWQSTFLALLVWLLHEWLQHLSRTADELNRTVAELRKKVDLLARKSSQADREDDPTLVPRQPSVDEMAQRRSLSLGWDDWNGKLEETVDAAIKESGATSLAQMGLVIKMVRGKLRGTRYAEKEFSSVVRERLQNRLSSTK